MIHQNLVSVQLYVLSSKLRLTLDQLHISVENVFLPHRCSQSPRAGSYWPGLGHVPIPEPTMFEWDGEVF